MRIAQAAALLAHLVLAPLSGAGAPAAAPTGSVPPVAVQDNAGWQ
ncbi:hypothetical protein ACFWAR_26455 [Streptomyces sp. NPDC059917]